MEATESFSLKKLNNKMKGTENLIEIFVKEMKDVWEYSKTFSKENQKAWEIWSKFLKTKWRRIEYLI